MIRRTAALRGLCLIALAAHAGCGGAAGGKEHPMHLASSAFAEGAAIPARHSCDGADLSPPLGWSGAPEGVKSFALILDDPDAPRGTFGHWAIFDIPPGRAALGEGVKPDAAGTRQAMNDFGRPGYGGPCPPRGHGPHRYRFRLYALDVASLPLPAHPDIAAVERAMQGHVAASALLTGRYGRD